MFNRELGISLGDIFDNDDKKLTQVLILNDENPVGTMRLRQLNDIVKIERMAILAESRGKEMGKVAINMIKNHCKNSGIMRIELDSIYSVRKFYESCGFHACGKPYKIGLSYVKVSLDL